MACMEAGEVVANPSIRIEGVLLPPATLDQDIPYLGAHLQLNLGTQAAVRALTGKVHQYCIATERRMLRPDRAVWLFNTFLIPSMSYALPFAHPTKQELRRWDTRVAGAISKVCRQPRKSKTAALATVTGLILPSHQHAVVTLSECFLRLNSNSADSTRARARWDRKDLRGSRSRLKAICSLAAEVDISLSRVPHRRPTSEQDCVLAGCLQLRCDGIPLCFGSTSWGPYHSGAPLVAYTDGSCSARSSWAVCFQNDWLRTHFSSLPLEDSLRARHLSFAVACGSPLRVDEGSGVFDAELHAIARAVQAPPLSCPLHIYSDSQAAIQAISRFRREQRARARLRMAGFSLLSLIDSIITRKSECGAPVVFSWVEAHSDKRSLHHAGNRIADFIAKQHSSASAHPPTTIRPLNLTFSHPFLVLRSAASTAAPPLLIGDPRRLCRRVMQSRALADWQLSKTQSRFSRFPVDARAFWLSIVSSSPSLAWLALRVVTDTLQWVWKDHKVCVRLCHECSCELTVEHLVRCHDARRERGGACVAVSRLMHSLGVAFQPLAAVWSSRADLPGVLKAFGILSAVSLDAETAALAGIFDAAVARRALRGRGASSNLCDAAVPALRLIIFSLLISRRFANT